jgi:hypothetical protein
MSMGKSRRIIGTITIATAVACLGNALPVSAEDVSAVGANEADRWGGTAYDLGLLRTTGLLKTVIGAVLWVPAYPLAIGSDQRESVSERLVVEPARDTFTRPLGEF